MKVSHDSETPAVGQQVITACAFIHRTVNGVTQAFLPRRAETKKFLPGKFEFPGGHIDFGEDLIQGLKREIYEEFHAEIIVGDPFSAFTYTNPVKGSHSVEIIFFATFSELNPYIHIEPEDHSEYRWVAQSEINTLFSHSETESDPEYDAIIKGFELLGGSSLYFANPLVN